MSVKNRQNVTPRLWSVRDHPRGWASLRVRQSQFWENPRYQVWADIRGNSSRRFR